MGSARMPDVCATPAISTKRTSLLLCSGRRWIAQGKVAAYLEKALGGIANCGCEQVLPKVTPFLNDGTIGVRVQAVRALQSMYAPGVETLLATSMLKDTAHEVRMTAVETAGIRPEPGELLLRAVSQAALTDTDSHVRYKAVDLVVRWLPKRSDLQATLQTVAKNDGEPQVRSRAQAGALATAPARNSLVGRQRSTCATRSLR